MQKLILILLAFLALFTIISAFGEAEAASGSSEKNISIDKSIKPVEIVQ